VPTDAMARAKSGLYVAVQEWLDTRRKRLLGPDEFNEVYWPDGGGGMTPSLEVDLLQENDVVRVKRDLGSIAVLPRPTRHLAEALARRDNPVKAIVLRLDHSGADTRVILALTKR
jgi:hypothetical protein